MTDHPALDAIKLLPPYHEPMDTELSCHLANDRIAELEAELAAERGKWCGTCGHRVWLGWRWTCPHLQAVVSASTEDAIEVPVDFGCTEYEPAEQGGEDE